MDIEQKDTYFVAVKVFLEKDGQLLILKDSFGYWDLPGGRLKVDEFSIPLEQVIARKMHEELGNDIQYTIGKPIIFMRHKRIEQTAGNSEVRIFALGYQGKLSGGDIHLSSRHTEMKWVDPRNFKPEEYFRGGWLDGVREYITQTILCL